MLYNGGVRENRYSNAEEMRCIMRAKLSKRIASLLLTFTMLMSLSTNLVSAANVYDNSNWPVLNSKCHLECYSYWKVNVYNSKNLKTRGTANPFKSYNSYIDKKDFLKITAIAPTYTEVAEFPTSNGKRKGYVKTNELFGTKEPLEVFTAAKKVTVYKFPGNDTKYGSTSVGDPIFKAGCTTQKSTGEKFYFIIYGANENNRGYKAGYVSEKTLKSLKDNSVPAVFRQNGNQPWSDVAYGKANGTNATLSSGGCGVLALTNAIYYATNGKVFVDPAIIADYSLKNGERVNNQGTKDTLTKNFLNNVGVRNCRFSRDEAKLSNVVDDLKRGCAVVAHVDGHFVCLADYSNGKFLVIDSYPSSNRKTSGGYRWMKSSEFTGRMALKTSKPLHIIKPS